MIKILDYASAKPEEILARAPAGALPLIEAVVAEIISAVRKGGDAAVFEYTRKFDGAAVSSLTVSEAEIAEALDKTDSDLTRLLLESAENIRRFHEKGKPEAFETGDADGVILGRRVLSLETVGVYVPGGTAAYPSSVLMTVIPAKVAGVSRIMIATPPGKDGKIAPAILAAANIAGVSDIFKMGGAQAVAAMAYGTQTVPKADKIVGPGNAYVAAAKRMVFGVTDIDMIAGPSEILIIADNTADPRFVAADMLSQAEHDVLSSAVLICESFKFATAVKNEIKERTARLPRAEIAEKSINNNGKIIIVPSIKDAIEAANKIAPEHLELCTADPFDLLPSVKNAGCVFLGGCTPEALGDYWAGPSHVLPTMGTARFSSPLSVDDFIKKSNYIYYSEDALRRVKDDVSAFAAAEGLHGHAESLAVRFEEGGDR
ncbi:MAG: histidinol dehydrogenase [Oscillospiraceae bacterium]|nr:histidinol dehydrogenase [Oscillospiraceae bacterium]